jgi:hypothetical protein
MPQTELFLIFTKPLGDIRGMIEVSGDAIDRSILDRWMPDLGLTEEWTIAAKGTAFAQS